MTWRVLPMFCFYAAALAQPSDVRPILEQATRLAGSVRDDGVRAETIPLLACLWAKTGDRDAAESIRELLHPALGIFDAIVKAYVLHRIALCQASAGDKGGALKTLDEAEKSANGAFGFWGNFWETWETEMPAPPGIKPAGLKPWVLEKIAASRSAVLAGDPDLARPPASSPSQPPQSPRNSGPPDARALRAARDLLDSKVAPTADWEYTGRSIEAAEVFLRIGDKASAAILYERALAPLRAKQGDDRHMSIARVAQSQLRWGLWDEAKRTAQLAGASWHDELLSEIAEAQLTRGLPVSEAIRTAELSSQPESKVALLCSIAERVSKTDEPAAQSAMGLARKTAENSRPNDKRIRTLMFATLAYSFALVGQLPEARAASKEIPLPRIRGEATRLIAFIETRNGQVQQSLAATSSESTAIRIYGWIGAAEALLNQPQPPSVVPSLDGPAWKNVIGR